MLFARSTVGTNKLRRDARDISVAIVAASLVCAGSGLATWQSLRSRDRNMAALRAHAVTLSHLLAERLVEVVRGRLDRGMEAGSDDSDSAGSDRLIECVAFGGASGAWSWSAYAPWDDARFTQAEAQISMATQAARSVVHGDILFLDASGSPWVLAVRFVHHAGEEAQVAWLNRSEIASLLEGIVRQREPSLELSMEPCGAWSEPLPRGLAFLRIQPTRATLRSDRDARVRLVLLLGPVSLVSVTALVGLIWRMTRVVRREAELSKLKDDFVAGVSHELKTPLSLIHLFAETLLEGRIPTEDKRREYYDVILRECARLTHLINNLLDFSRLQAGRKPLELTPQEVGPVVRGVYDAYRPELEHARMRHELSIEPNLPLVAMDREAVAQAVLNLMSNAVKYSQEEREMRIEVTSDVRRGRRGVLISVHDRGIGIAPHERDRVFEGFFRGSDPRVRARRGTGVGLALVRHIVDMHGGIASVESRLTGGTTFRIFLPACEPLSPSPPSTLSDPP